MPIFGHIHSTLGDFVLFVDDTNIFVTGKDEKSAYLKANIVLEKVHEYMYSNQLHINTEKSCYMHIHPIGCALFSKFLGLNAVLVELDELSSGGTKLFEI